MEAPVVTAAGRSALFVNAAAAPSDGGSPITSYDGRYSVDPAGVDPAWTELLGIDPDLWEIDGQAAGTAVYVQTRAVNAIGSGEWSPNGSGTTEAANQPPVVSDDTLTITEGDSVTIDFIALASDPEGGELALVGPPVALHGTIDQVDLEAGTARYTAPAFATDTISFIVSDGEATDTGEIAVTVQEAADTAPDAFAFTDQADAYPSTADVTSSKVTITGIEAPASVSISGDASSEFEIYAIDGTTVIRPWGTAAATVTAGQQIAVRVDAAPAAATETQAVLSVGGVSATFTVTTAAGVVVRTLPTLRLSVPDASEVLMDFTGSDFYGGESSATSSPADRAAPAGPVRLAAHLVSGTIDGIIALARPGLHYSVGAEEPALTYRVEQNGAVLATSLPYDNSTGNKTLPIQVIEIATNSAGAPEYSVEVPAAAVFAQETIPWTDGEILTSGAAPINATNTATGLIFGKVLLTAGEDMRIWSIGTVGGMFLRQHLNGNLQILVLRDDGTPQTVTLFAYTPATWLAFFIAMRVSGGIGTITPTWKHAGGAWASTAPNNTSAALTAYQWTSATPFTVGGTSNLSNSAPWQSQRLALWCDGAIPDFTTGGGAPAAANRAAFLDNSTLDLVNPAQSAALLGGAPRLDIYRTIGGVPVQDGAGPSLTLVA